MGKYATHQRETLLGYLRKHVDEALSARQIADELRGEGISQSAVYRNLAALEAEGCLRRRVVPESTEICYQFADSDCAGKLHLSCTSCGKTFHVDAGVTEQLASLVAHEKEFTLDRFETVLYGKCRSCSKARGKGKTAK